MLGGDSSAVKIQLLCNNSELSVGAAQLAKLGEAFAPGDAVKRAMLSGQEEDATVRLTALRRPAMSSRLARLR